MLRKILRAMLFVLPIIVLLPHISDFVYLPGSQFSDIPVSHYPNALFLQRYILESGMIPTWSPGILSGFPFVANPLSGLHYLPGLLALLFPLPAGFNLVLILHMLMSGIGMFMFLRLEGIREEAALLGALAFEALPKLYSHIGAGHLTLVYAIAWTPWLLYVEKKFTHAHSSRWVLPGVLIGLIALADIRWAAYSGILWLAFSLRNFLCQSKIQRGKFRIFDRAIILWAVTRLANILIGLCIAAPLIFPLAQFTALSTRSQLTTDEITRLSLPPSQLIGLFFPNIGGAAEWSLYPGAVMIVLAVFSLCKPAVRKASLFWQGAAGVTILIALGSNIPFLENLFRLPGLSLLRVPPRALFLTGLAMCVIAGHSLDSLLAQDNEPRAGKDPTNLVLFGLASFITLFALAVWWVVKTPLPRIQFTWGAVFTLAGTAAIGLVGKRWLRPSGLVVFLTAAALIDLIGVNGLSLVFHSSNEVFAQGAKAADYITRQNQGQPARVYSPSYSIPQQTAARYRLQLADGVDPMQLADYSRFMEGATGVPSQGYSVTLPSFASGDPAIDNRQFLPDGHKLGLLNVKYIAADFPLDSGDFIEQVRFGETRVYLNTKALPRAWIQPQNSPLGKNPRTVDITRWRPNQIEVRADGPGQLVLSELYYPGWEAMVDGQPAQVEKLGDLLRGIVLPEGPHMVTFEYRPAWFYAGMVTAGATWLFLLGLWIHSWRKNRG